MIGIFLSTAPYSESPIIQAGVVYSTGTGKAEAPFGFAVRLREGGEALNVQGEQVAALEQELLYKIDELQSRLDDKGGPMARRMRSR